MNETAAERPAMRFLPTVVTAWVAARLLVAGVWVVLTLVDRTSRVRKLDEGLMAWDGDWYELIARAGYTEGGEEIRFFPLYPALGKLVAFAFFGRVDLGLMVVANVASFGALWLMAVWAARASGSDVIASRAVWALSLWPAGFVMVFAYSEGLFLTLAIGCAVALQRRRWWLVAVLAALAGFTRPTALALAVLIAATLLTEWHATDRRDRVRAMVAVGGPLVGVAAFAVLADAWYGDWQGPFDVQELLRGDLVDPLSRLWQGLTDALGPERFGDGLHFPFAVLAVAAVVLVWRTIGRAEGAFAAAVVLVAISAENWNSIERYTMNAFPVFAAFGATVDRVPRAARFALAGVSAAGLAALTTLAWTGHYVP